MKLEDIIFKPFGLGEPPYKFEEVIVTNPECNVTGLYEIHKKLYKKVYIL